jgi:hypothetical protein
MSLTESIVEDAGLESSRDLGWAVGHRRQKRVGEPATMRGTCGELLLLGRLRNSLMQSFRVRVSLWGHDVVLRGRLKVNQL